EYCKGLYLKGMGKYDEAINVYEQLNQLQEFSWNYYQMAIIKNLQNKTNEAIKLLKITFTLEPELKNDAKQFLQLQNLWGNIEFIEITK
ncbi:MAG: tetratricopeptide repeat protein, partial [Ferruginibacter sp.]